MFTFIHGVPWLHVVPALFAVIAALLYLWAEQIYVKVILGVLWLLLLPNTIYILTDLGHLVHQWGSGNLLHRTAWILQYILLGIIGLVTYLVAFGVVLGKTGYINSYVVFT
jgi:uncharacterized membrane protein